MFQILIVEDEKTVADFMKQTIKRSYPNTRIVHVPTGTKGLKLLQQQSFDLLITDFRLPGLSGLSLIEQIRENNPQLLIVLATAYAPPDIESRMRDLNINAYLQKPFTVEKLVVCLSSLIPSEGEQVTP